MLGKLLKFEFKATSRTFLPLYLAALILTLLSKGFIFLQESKIFADYNTGIIGKIIGVLSGIIMFTFVVLLVAIAFLTFFVIVQRFYKNLFTDEGYLMHTLPVSPKAHIGAKLITSTVWVIASVAVIILSIFLLVIDKSSWQTIVDFFDNLPMTAKLFEMAMNMNFYSFIAKMAVYLLFYIPAGIMNFYLAIALGSVILPKHKIGGAFLGYVIIYTVSQIAGSVALAAGMMFMSESLNEMLRSPVPPAHFIDYILGFSGLYSVISSIAGFFITSHILTKKLNLE